MELKVRIPVGLEQEEGVEEGPAKMVASWSLEMGRGSHPEPGWEVTTAPGKEGDSEKW